MHDTSTRAFLFVLLWLFTGYLFYTACDTQKKYYRAETAMKNQMVALERATYVTFTLLSEYLSRSLSPRNARWLARPSFQLQSVVS